MAASSDKNTHIGQVEWFDAKKGFGFIRNYNQDGTEGKQIFIHYSDIQDNKSQDRRILTVGDQVKYEEEEVQGKEPKAVNVRPIVGKLINDLSRKSFKPNNNNYNDLTYLNIGYELAKTINDISNKIKGGSKGGNKGKGKGGK